MADRESRSRTSTRIVLIRVIVECLHHTPPPPLFRRRSQFNMPVLLSTGDLGNRIDILQGNGVTEDLTVDRSVVSEAIIDSEDSVVLQVSQQRHLLSTISFRF